MKSGKKFSARFFVVMLALSLIAVMNGCKKDDNEPASGGGGGSPGANEVWMQSNAFTPNSITVNVNTTITWKNKDSAAHTVTSDSGSELNSPTISGGGTFTHNFTTAGTFHYHCNFHGGMNGTVIVQ